MSDAPAVVPSVRRYDLDWIRVIAFMLLILYHIGMFYVPWEWHVKSRYELEWLEPVMQLTNPWRLTLLFLVSGCATRFLADSLDQRGWGTAHLAGSRTLRLLPRSSSPCSWWCRPRATTKSLNTWPALA